MQIKVRLSGSLREIYSGLPKESLIELDKPETVDSLLCKMKINPLVVMEVAVDGKGGKKDALIEENCEVFLIGPIAGG